MGYRAMKQLRDAIAKVQITDKELWFSTCNLSYDYNDDDSAVSLVELDTTARIVLGFIGCFFTTLADTGSEDPNKEPEAQIDVLAVAGAGHADANGIYIREPPHVQKGGRPGWTHEIDDKYKIQWSKMMSHWMIDQVGGPSPYCMQGGDDALPVGGTWVIYERSGTLPNPSVEPIGTEAQQDVSEKPEAQIDVLAVAGAGHADANGIYIREPPHVQKGGRPVWTHEIIPL